MAQGKQAKLSGGRNQSFTSSHNLVLLNRQRQTAKPRTVQGSKESRRPEPAGRLGFTPSHGTAFWLASARADDGGSFKNTQQIIVVLTHAPELLAELCFIFLEQASHGLHEPVAPLSQGFACRSLVFLEFLPK